MRFHFLGGLPSFSRYLASKQRHRDAVEGRMGPPRDCLTRLGPEDFLRFGLEARSMVLLET